MNAELQDLLDAQRGYLESVNQTNLNQYKSEVRGFASQRLENIKLLSDDPLVHRMVDEILTKIS